MKSLRQLMCAAVCAAASLTVPAFAQNAPVAPRASTAAAAVAGAITPPPGYVIGPDDVLSIVFWRDKDMTADVVVRPDGKVTLPLVNDLTAVGLTPEELRVSVTEAAGKYLEEPSVTVIVKTINSRKVFITGQVNKPGSYPLGGPTTVLQLIALAGGVLEYADSENIAILRQQNGRSVSYRFNYKEIATRKNLGQNIELQPGDTIVVP